jgi:polar amino acid transport system substrate-binding protein
MTQSTMNELAAASVVEEIKKRGALRVGMWSFHPWAMQDKSGKWIGYEIDVATRLAEDMGVKLELVPTPYAQLVPDLKTGKFDVIISGIGITPERNLEINFSIPYKWIGVGILVGKQHQGKISSIADLNKPEIKLVRRGAAVAKNIWRDYFPKAQDQQLEDDAKCLQAVLDGEAHAIISNDPKPHFALMQRPDAFYITPGLHPIEHYCVGVGMRKGDPDALNLFNNWVDQRDKDGWLKERSDLIRSTTIRS